MRELRSAVTALDAELARSAPTALGRPELAAALQQARAAGAALGPEGDPAAAGRQIARWTTATPVADVQRALEDLSAGSPAAQPVLTAVRTFLTTLQRETPPTAQQEWLVRACRSAFGVLQSDVATASACTSRSSQPGLGDGGRQEQVDTGGTGSNGEGRRPDAADVRAAAAEVARARVAVRERALMLADDTGRAAALSALATAQEEAGATAQDRAAGTGEQVSVARAFTAGVEAVRLPGGTAGRIPLAPEEVGWALALLAALFGYRLLEVLNSGLDAGPVEIDDPKASPEVSILRHHLVRNVPEPGSQPGSSASSSITTSSNASPRTSCCRHSSPQPTPWASHPAATGSR
jgi:hypothetical protein